jgi:beta-alanine degradation protein BauB
MQQAEAIIRVDTDEVRVTEYRFAPGAATGHHRHGYDYVVVPLTAGRLKLLAAAGESAASLEPGAAYFRKAGVEHDVINAGTEPLVFIEIELKHRPG